MARQIKAISKGFSMIEVMVSVLVVAVGLLAVANFQGGLMGQSSTNKARAEATALAQARIEQLRNYTNDVASEGDFDTLFAATGGFTNNATVNGVNAQFTRSENVAVTADMKEVTVQVTWTGSNGRAQAVTLDTELSWESPRTVGDIARDDDDLIPSPTGRAILGEGYLPTGAPTVSNGDGTAIYDAGDDDLRLALGNVVVLTLKDACLTGSCIDFVTISGRIHIDTASQSITPGEVFVKASDAAFCQRYWVDNSGNTNTVMPNTTSTITTANGDYEYFDYTCYLGGGWFGNIGLVLGNGISQRDKACLGDPLSANSWEQPVIAARRAYRGMLYKHDGQGGKVEYLDGNGNALTRYWSIGVADALKLPATGDAGHDFVLADMTPGDTTGDKCISNGTLVRTDSNVSGTPGDLFAGVPTDFVCLNPSNVDAFDTSDFGAETYCPYDPTEPPTLAHTISGEIAVDAELSFQSIVEAMFVTTTDGPGNCTVGSFTHDGNDFEAPYSCRVFDWGNGWTGDVNLIGNFTELDCNDTQESYTNLTSDDTNEDFNCQSVNEDPGDPVNVYQVAGSVTLPGNRSMTSVVVNGGTCTFSSTSYACEVTTSATTWTGNVTFTSSGGNWCTVDTAEGDMDNPTGTAVFTALAPGSYTFDVTGINGSCGL